MYTFRNWIAPALIGALIGMVLTAMLLIIGHATGVYAFTETSLPACVQGATATDCYWDPAEHNGLGTPFVVYGGHTYLQVP